MAKKKEEKEKITIHKKLYHAWERYDDFVRSIHLESEKNDKKNDKENDKKKILNFLKKIIVILIASLITSSTLYFLIKPNKLINPGLSGLLQKFSEWLTKEKKEISFSLWTLDLYFLYYYGTNFLINSAIVLFLWLKYDANIYEIGTSLIYVIFQIIWTTVFQKFNLKDDFFNDFNPNVWRRKTHAGETTSTFPYFVIIAIISSIIHTFGYSLIFRIRATPGGLEIISSFFALKPNSKFSINIWIKRFSYFVLFLTTLFDFFVIEENQKKNLRNYLSFLSNNKFFWAGIFYIITATIVMNWLFPREQIIMTEIYPQDENKLSEILKLLEDFSPVYNIFLKKKVDGEEKVYGIKCYMSRWNFFLLEPNLKKKGKVYVIKSEN